MTSRNGTGALATGRLELTWANKDRRLLAHDDVTYEWVDPNDWRVSEVRLLDEVGRYGDDSSGNLLIQGDAMHALTALTSIPEYAEQYVGKVKLAYLDPPFNTGQTFQQYDDSLEHSVWLTMLRDRLEQIHRLLAADGSVWVHLDDVEAHRARCVLDEVFGADNFVATFIWERTDIPAMQADVTIKQDYIHVYQRSPAFKTRKGLRESEVPAHYDRIDEDGRRYCLRTLRMTGAGSQRSDRETMWYPITAPDNTEVWPVRSDGSEGRWRWGPDRYEADKDKIEWHQTPDGRWEPYRRIYAGDGPQRPPETLLRYTEFGSNRIAKLQMRNLVPGTTPFSTPKPEQLLRHIVETATDEGDLVLDCFGGSGTTASVAHKLRRRWITVELSDENVDTFVRPRLQGVIDGTDNIGISIEHAERPARDLPEDVGPDEVRRAAKVLQELVDHGSIEGLDDAQVKQIARQLRAAGKVTKSTSRLHSGGGGFTELKIAPSMFEELDGTVVLSDWASNGKLADHVAAQLGFTRQADAPFAGRKGRTRLAVIDGMLTAGVADHLIAHLEERETVTVVAVALDPGVEEHLRASRPGSRARKVPRDLARSGKLPSRLVRIGYDKGPGQ